MATIHAAIFIEEDNSQFEVSVQSTGQHVLTLVPYEVNVYLTRVQLVILRDQLTAFLGSGQ